MNNYRNMSGQKSTAGRFKLYFKLSLIAVVLLAVFALFYACQQNQAPKLNFDDVKLIQNEIPKDDAPVAVFETSLGTFKAVLYPDEAADYCEYFTGLVKKGYYDGTHICSVEDGVYFIGGSKQSDNTVTSDTDQTEIKTGQLSKNLWPFKGALCAYTYDNGFLFWKEKVSSSFLVFVNDYKLTDEENSQLDTYLKEGQINKDITNAFKEKGGVLNFSQQYTVFGQVYDGFDVYEKISTYDVKDDKSKQPIDDIVFKKVYMSTYGENKKDDAFSAKQADSSKADAKSDSNTDASSEK